MIYSQFYHWFYSGKQSYIELEVWKDKRFRVNIAFVENKSHPNPSCGTWSRVSRVKSLKTNVVL